MGRVSVLRPRAGFADLELLNQPRKAQILSGLPAQVYEENWPEGQAHHLESDKTVGIINLPLCSLLGAFDVLICEM